jgi:molybdopterin converting factor small subunit
MARLRLFGPVREAAGVREEQIDAATVAELLQLASSRHGAEFVALLSSCKVWVNGVIAAPDALIGDGDEVALLPPVSGG